MSAGIVELARVGPWRLVRDELAAALGAPLYQWVRVAAVPRTTADIRRALFLDPPPERLISDMVNP